MESEVRNNVRSEIISWIKVIVFAVVFAFFINNFVIVNAKIPTGSMEKTIMTGDRVVAFRLSYVFSEPERGDIVVFPYPDDESVLYVKRIIGMPGETVTIKNGQVYINDSSEPMDNSFTNGVTVWERESITVPEGEYFMLGDNRTNSKDSRAWKTPFVKKEKLLGKVVFKYFNKFELLYNK